MNIIIIVKCKDDVPGSRPRTFAQECHPYQQDFSVSEGFAYKMAFDCGAKELFKWMDVNSPTKKKVTKVQEGQLQLSLNA